MSEENLVTENEPKEDKAVADKREEEWSVCWRRWSMIERIG